MTLLDFYDRRWWSWGHVTMTYTYMPITYIIRGRCGTECWVNSGHLEINLPWLGWVADADGCVVMAAVCAFACSTSSTTTVTSVSRSRCSDSAFSTFWWATITFFLFMLPMSRPGSAVIRSCKQDLPCLLMAGLETTFATCAHCGTLPWRPRHWLQIVVWV